ncbi:hypothetical protein AB0D08_18660 [Kitasatospora sp. NPDC048540]|uniref:hypothetical protein n=1 Tax=unclassified Kitasatospora TaxID=2633591 RepID=UPI0011EA6439|nr:hypothetical protein [Kitasatospora sp. MBT63]
MTDHHGPAGPAVCAGPCCDRRLPSRARTGRPGLYCGQACRQAALRRRRLAEQAPHLRDQAQELLRGIDLPLADSGRERLAAMDGEQLVLAVRQARTVHKYLAALRETLGLPPHRMGLRTDYNGETPGRNPRPARRGPHPGPGQQPVPTELINLFLEPPPPAR